MKEIEDRPDSHEIVHGPYGNSEIRDLLDNLGVVPQKSMGQNFLTDSSVAETIVTALDPREEDVVIEIGPGTGALTHYLAGRVRRLILAEFDRSLPMLQNLTQGRSSGRAP